MSRPIASAEELGDVTAQRAEESRAGCLPNSLSQPLFYRTAGRQAGWRIVIDLQFQVPNIPRGTNSGTANAASITLRERR